MDTSLFLLICHAHALHLEYHSDEYTGRGQLHILYLGVQVYVHTKPDKLKTQLSFFGLALDLSTLKWRLLKMLFRVDNLKTLTRCVSVDTENGTC